MSGNLVIVESPAKAKTIERYLGPGYTVLASYGHVRDLPENPGKNQLGVDVDNDFTPVYEVVADRKKQLAAIQKAAAKSDLIYLATDLDREGEAIAWHVAEAANLSPERTRRVTFSEITESAIKKAFSEPRSIDKNLVDAQQARRVVDRLVGYTLSPLLWRKVRAGLSAGRVQSVAVRIVVDREREIRAFSAREYWTLQATLVAPDGTTFEADLVKIAGKKPEIADGETATRHPDARAALHHVEPSAGSQPQTGLLAQANDERGPTTVRRRSDRRGPDRTHHLHANRLRRALEPGDDRGCASDRGSVRPGLHHAPWTGVQDQDQERPGGPRGHPADVVHARSRRSGQVPAQRRGQALPPDLAACHRQPDGR